MTLIKSYKNRYFPIEIHNKVVEHSKNQFPEGREDLWFEWGKTPEGYEFWCKILFENIKNNYDIFYSSVFFKIIFLIYYYIPMMASQSQVHISQLLNSLDHPQTNPSHLNNIFINNFAQKKVNKNQQ